MTHDPINDPENADLSEAEVCQHCHALIRPGEETCQGDRCYHVACAPQQQPAEPDRCHVCGSPDHLWRPFGSPRLYCTTCVPTP